MASTSTNDPVSTVDGQASDARIGDAVPALVTELGEDPSREGLEKTPDRVAKAMRFLTSGYARDIDEVINDALFTVDYSEMVIVKDIDFYSLCEHRSSADAMSPTFHAARSSV